MAATRSVWYTCTIRDRIFRNRIDPLDAYDDLGLFQRSGFSRRGFLEVTDEFRDGLQLPLIEKGFLTATFWRPELFLCVHVSLYFVMKLLLYVHRNHRFIRDGSPGHQPRLSHSSRAWFNIALRPRKPEGSLGRTAQDVHIDSHTAPEL